MPKVTPPDPSLPHQRLLIRQQEEKIINQRRQEQWNRLTTDSDQALKAWAKPMDPDQ